MTKSNKMRYVTVTQVSIPAGVTLELTKAQAEKLGDSVKLEQSGLRNDLNATIPDEDKVLPAEEEE